MTIQAVWFDSNKWSESAASDWCAENDFINDVIRTREEDDVITHWIFPQFSPDEAVPDTWRTIWNDFPDGVSASTCRRREMEESKSYSTFTVKSFDEDLRVIRGVASTPTPDREGDIVVPKGASFKLPLPLLAQHDHNQPVGLITEASITDDGIEVEAQIAKDSGLAYVERTWRQVKAGLLRGLSVGFRATKAKPISSGVMFEKWEWLELSLVSIAANAEASVSSVKQYSVETDIDLEEQLLEAEAKSLDAMNRTAEAIELINSTLNKSEN